MSEKNFLKAGHGLTDISCKHGSRWIWWYDPICTGKLGKWEQVIQFSNCHCGDPPLPFKTHSQVIAYLQIKKGNQGVIE